MGYNINMQTPREIHLNSILDDIDIELGKIMDKFLSDPIYKLSPDQADLMVEVINLYKNQVDTLYELSHNRLNNL